MGEKLAYVIVRSADIPADILETYWKALEVADTLKYRFSHQVKVSWADAVIMRTDVRYLMYSIMTDKGIIAEFALETFTGKAAQIHFSMHPDNSSLRNYKIMQEVGYEILNVWKNEDKEPYLDTLYGLTPVDNTMACRLIQKVGFEKIGILPSGTKYLGEVTDAMLTVKTRN